MDDQISIRGSAAQWEAISRALANTGKNRATKDDRLVLVALELELRETLNDWAAHTARINARCYDE